MKRFLLLFACTLTFTGCDLFGTDESPESVVSSVYVANQGNFSDGNGSVSTYNPETQQTAPGAISDVNALVQSLYLQGENLYVIANTGGRVDAHDAATLQRTSTITGLLSPRYMATHDTLGFVTNLYGDAATFSGGTVSILDLKRNVKLRDVAVGDNPEGIGVATGRVYVANSGFGYGTNVSVLNAATGLLAATIDVDCDGPRSIAVDAEDEVWVFCSGQTMYDAGGNVTGQTNGAVRVLEGATGRIIARIAVDGQIGSASLGQDVFYSAAAQEVYVVLDAERIARFSTRTNLFEALITSATLTGGAAGTPAPIGAIAYDAQQQRLYVGRVPDFTTAGRVTLHQRDGTPTTSFSAGVVPTFILFRESVR